MSSLHSSVVVLIISAIHNSISSNVFLMVSTDIFCPALLSLSFIPSSARVDTGATLALNTEIFVLALSFEIILQCVRLKDVFC